MAETQGSKTVSTKLERIAEIAKRKPGEALTSLSHHIDMDWMREAHRRTRKDGAVGVDEQTAAEYAVNIEENLALLLDRAKSGDQYRAPPVRRVYIPKGNTGKMRPIGIPCFEDKVLQKVASMALNAVYEQDFLDCSYGFRPGRSQHMALQAFWDQVMPMHGGWVLELDVEAFDDSIDKGLLQEMLRKRIRDEVLLRLIGKWLSAGVMEEGVVYHPEQVATSHQAWALQNSSVYLPGATEQRRLALRCEAHQPRTSSTAPPTGWNHPLVSRRRQPSNRQPEAFRGQRTIGIRSRSVAKGARLTPANGLGAAHQVARQQFRTTHQPRGAARHQQCTRRCAAITPSTAPSMRLRPTFCNNPRPQQ